MYCYFCRLLDPSLVIRSPIAQDDDKITEEEGGEIHVPPDRTESSEGTIVVFSHFNYLSILFFYLTCLLLLGIMYVTLPFLLHFSLHVCSFFLPASSVTIECGVIALAYYLSGTLSFTQCHFTFTADETSHEYSKVLKIVSAANVQIQLYVNYKTCTT